MIKNNGLFENSGFSMVEAMIGISLLSILGIGAMKLSETQHQATRGQERAQELSQMVTTINEVIINPKACEYNLLGKEVGKNIKLTELKNSKGESVLKTGTNPEGGNYQLSEIQIGEFSHLTNRTRLNLTFKQVKGGLTSATTNRFFYIFTEVQNGKITKCLDPIELSSKTIVKKICQDLDPLETSSCADNFNNLLFEVKRYYCGTGHPFLEFDQSSGRCKPLDADKKCGAGYLKGYNANGDLICYTPPASCSSWGNWQPSTGNVCPSSTLTQTRVCSVGGPATQTRTVAGTRSDLSCCTSWNAWGPSETSVCIGSLVSQTRSCIGGASGSESRTIPGTGTGASCCTSWSNWTPLASTVCSGNNVTQTRNCTAGGNGTESRIVAGTNTGPFCCSKWSSWAPGPETACMGTDVTQNRTCEAGSTGNETRIVPGTGDGESCCSSWSDWSPGPENTCPGNKLTQTRNCTSGATATETRNIFGTMNNKNCCIKWNQWEPTTEFTCPGALVSQIRICTEGWEGEEFRQVNGTKISDNWLPDPGLTCIEENLTQTNECGETRSIKGTKECNDCTIQHPAGWSVNFGTGNSCHCVQNAAIGSSTLSNGLQKTINTMKCEIYDVASGAKKKGHGTLIYKCNNGSLNVVNKTCQVGGIQ